MKKKVLITGGSGTVGSAFIEKYYDDYTFFNISRNETNIANLSRRFPKVTSFLGDITDGSRLINIFEEVKPDLVIHAAALKHINLAETNPTVAVEVNVMGSLNVIIASIRAEVPVTIGVSTDKACDPGSVYGYSKSMMEQMFYEHHNYKTKFVCTRFANVAASNGSVIPFWKELAAAGEPLRLTHPDMNRLMFSKQEAAELINNAYENAKIKEDSFILSNIMKSVNLLELAKVISDKDVVDVGLRPGEKLNEILVSSKELSYTIVEGNLIFIYKDRQPEDKNLKQPHSSLTAEKMNKQELLELIK